MPLKHYFEPEQPYFVTRFVAQIEDAVLLEFYGRIFTGPVIQLVSAEFVDLEEADLSLLTTRGLESLAKLVETLLSEQGIGSFMTAVYSPADLPFGLARVYQAWADTSPELVRVFRDRSEAIDWLCE